jgi:hypothetical protein
MPQFTVPKFIEMEPKIVGPFTFKQFIFVGLAGAVCFVLYFSLSKTNFFLFTLLTIFLIGGALAFAFLKIGGRSLPTILQNFFSFLFSSKIYLWKRKAAPSPIIKKEEPKLKRAEEVPTPKIAGKSRLKNLSTQIELKTK